MAEFCPECWNKLNGFHDPPESYRLSWTAELCEGCGEWKRIVIGKRKYSDLRRLLNRLLRRT